MRQKTPSISSIMTPTFQQRGARVAAKPQHQQHHDACLSAHEAENPQHQQHHYPHVSKDEHEQSPSILSARRREAREAASKPQHGHVAAASSYACLSARGHVRQKTSSISSIMTPTFQQRRARAAKPHHDACLSSIMTPAFQHEHVGT